MVRCYAIFALAFLSVSSTFVQAVDYYWDVNPNTTTPGNDVREGGSGNFDNLTANFTTSATDSSAVNHVLYTVAAAGGLATNLDTITFGGATGGTVTISATANTLGSSTNSGIAANALIFEATGDATNYTLTGSNIRLLNGASSGRITVNTGVLATIASGIAGNAAGGINANNTTSGTVDSLIDINGGGTLRVTGGGNSQGYNITGNTTLEAAQTANSQGLSGFNLITINAGSTLRTINTNILQPPGSLTGDGLFDINGTLQNTGTIGGNLAVTNSTAAAASLLNLTLLQTTAVHTGVVSNGAGKTSIATVGGFGQGNNFTSTTAFNQQTFAGANTYTGSTTFGRGTVALDFSVATAPVSNILYNAGFVGSNVALAAADDGSLNFNAPLQTLNGTTNMAGGTIATLIFTGKASTANSQAFSGTNFQTNGAASILINPNATANTVALNLGTITRQSGGVVNFATTNATTTLSASASILSNTGTANSLLTSNGVAYATFAGQDWAAKDATNTAVVSGSSITNFYTSGTANAFTPGANITTVTAGGGGNDVRLAGNTSIASLRYANSGRIGLNLGGNTLTSGGLLISSASNVSGNYLGNGNLTSPGSDVTIVQYAGTSNRFFGLTASVVDGAAGATGLTKSGTGVIELLGNNTYSGQTVVQQGGLIVTGTNNTSGVFINGSQTNLTGTGLPAAGTGGAYLQLGNNSAAGTIGTGLVNVGLNSILGVKSTTDVVINNNISGLGGFTQGWSGTTTLLSAATAKYTYTGDTTVTAGTLRLDYSGSNTGIISDASRLVLGGGRVLYSTIASTTQNDVVRETVLLSGGTTIDKDGTGAGRLRLNSINSVSTGSSLNFTADGVADIDTTNTNGIILQGGVARATVAGANWAVNGTNGGDGAVNGLTTYAALATAAGTDTTNSLLANSSATLAGARTTNTLKFDNTSGSAQTLDLGGSQLTVTAGGLLTTGNSAAVIGNGLLRSNTATNSDLVVHQYNSGGLTINATINNGTGNSTLTKAGTGTLTLTAANTYTGQTYINGGVLSINSNAALGAEATGAGLQLNNGTLQATSTFGLFNGAAGTNNRGITVNGIGGTVDVTGANTFTIAGFIGGVGGLTKVGTGTLSIANYGITGPTVVNEGTFQQVTTGIFNPNTDLIVGAAGTFNLNALSTTVGSLAGSGIVTNTGAAQTFSVGALHNNTLFSGQLTGALNLDKFGGGTMTVSGAANNYTGSTTVSGGTLALTGGGILSANSALNVSSAAAALDISGITAASTSVGSLTSIVNSAINLGGKTLSSGINNGNTTSSGTISGVGGGLLKDGTGTLTIGNTNNTYTGATTLQNGTLRFAGSVPTSAASSLGSAPSAIIVGTAASSGGSRITLLGTSAGIISRDIDATSGSSVATDPNFANRYRVGADIAAGGTLSLAGNLAFGASGGLTVGRTLELTAVQASTTLNVSGIISSTPGAVALLVNGGNSGAGTVRFGNAANSFTAPLTVTAGTLLVGADAPNGAVGALGNNTGNVSLADGATPVTASVSLLTDGAFTIGRGIALSNAASGGVPVSYTLGGNTATASVFSGNVTTVTNTTADKLLFLSQVANGSVTFNGAIAPNADPVRVLNVEKIGGGIAILTGANTYDGNTTVTAGTLLANNATGSAIGTGNVSVSANSIFGGTGAITGNVLLTGGTLSPGASIEDLTVGGVSGTGNLLIEYSGVSNPAIDLLNVSGDFNIGSITLNFASLSGTLADPSYIFATYGTLTGGAFANVNNTPSGYNLNYAFNGNNIALVSAVPEPSTIMLLVFASVAAYIVHRRRKNRVLAC